MIDEARFNAIKERFKEMDLVSIPDVAFLISEVEIALAAEKRRISACRKYYDANRDTINANRRGKREKGRGGGETNVRLGEEDRTGE